MNNIILKIKKMAGGMGGGGGSVEGDGDGEQSKSDTKSKGYNFPDDTDFNDKSVNELFDQWKNSDKKFSFEYFVKTNYGDEYSAIINQKKQQIESERSVGPKDTAPNYMNGYKDGFNTAKANKQKFSDPYSTYSEDEKYKQGYEKGFLDGQQTTPTTDKKEEPTKPNLGGEYKPVQSFSNKPIVEMQDAILKLHDTLEKDDSKKFLEFVLKFYDASKISQHQVEEKEGSKPALKTRYNLQQVLENLKTIGAPISSKTTKTKSDGSWGPKTNNALHNVENLAKIINNLSEDLDISDIEIRLSPVELIPIKSTDINLKTKVERAPKLKYFVNDVSFAFSQLKEKVREDSRYKKYFKDENEPFPTTVTGGEKRLQKELYISSENKIITYTYPNGAEVGIDSLEEIPKPANPEIEQTSAVTVYPLKYEGKPEEITYNIKWDPKNKKWNFINYLGKNISGPDEKEYSVHFPGNPAPPYNLKPVTGKAVAIKQLKKITDYDKIKDTGKKIEIIWNPGIKKWKFKGVKLADEKQINAYKINKDKPIITKINKALTPQSGLFGTYSTTSISLENLSSIDNFKKWLERNDITFNGVLAHTNKKLMLQALNKIKTGLNQ